MKKTFESTIIFIIFSTLCCYGLAEGQTLGLSSLRIETFPDKPIARLGKGWISEIVYSPDGKLLVVAGSVGIWLYDARTLQEVGLLKGYTDPVPIRIKRPVLLHFANRRF